MWIFVIQTNIVKNIFKFHILLFIIFHLQCWDYYIRSFNMQYVFLYKLTNIEYNLCASFQLHILVIYLWKMNHNMICDKDQKWMTSLLCAPETMPEIQLFCSLHFPFVTHLPPPSLTSDFYESISLKIVVSWTIPTLRLKEGAALIT